MMPKFSRISQNWLVIIIAMTLLAIGLVIFRLFGSFTTAEAINIFLIAALVLVTTVYAKEAAKQTKASEKMMAEMRESKFASLQPIVVMGRAPTYGVVTDARQVSEQTTIDDQTWLYNVGPGPALNLRFYLKEPSRKNPSGTIAGKELRALSPGEAYELMIFNTFGQRMQSSHDLVVEYEDVFGGKWCSGLELNYTSGPDRYTVIKLFYEKMS